jgi:Na+-translocating ferredoxin:NAD+ oxidoreductase RnfE subunit
MKPWEETSRNSKITTSSMRGLAATPSRLPVKATCIYVFFRTLIIVKTMWMSQTYDVIDYYSPFMILLGVCPCFATESTYNNKIHWDTETILIVFMLSLLKC